MTARLNISINMDGPGCTSLDGTRNDIESIFPLNAAPWTISSDALASSSHPPLLRFDYGASLIPWRFRILFGIHTYGLHSARSLMWDDVGFDKLNRKSVWRKFGQTLHFFTLEFADVSLEKGYQLDFATRSKYYVQVSGLAVALIALVVIGKTIQDSTSVLSCSTGELFASDGLFSLFLISIVRWIVSVYHTEELLGHFQLIQTCWAVFTVLTCLSVFYYNPKSTCVIPNQESGTYSALMILIALFGGLRFVYLFFLILGSTVFVLAARWSSETAGMVGFMDPLLMTLATFGSLTVVYIVEVLLRKDFVQSLAVTTESQRSDRLLRNVLPTRIIDTLKRRQDGSSALGGTVGPGATALFTRTRGSHPGSEASGNPMGSQMFVQRGHEISRFDSRVGSSTLANTALAEAFDCVSILFADVVGFTKISSRVTPEQLVLLLNELFTVFDNIADQNGLEKIKTIGDCYMVCGGLPNPHPLHAHAVARMGLQMIEAVSMFCDDQGDPLLIRLGMHTGSCVAGVIGRRKFIYDVWGDCVNTASRMESHGEPMKLHCSQATAEKIQLDFELESRGELQVKGKGKMSTYFITSEQPHSRFRSVLPADIAQWRDRFSSGRASVSDEKGSLQSVDELAPTDMDDADDEVF